MGRDAPMLDGNSGGMELRPMREPSTRLMVNTDFFRWRPAPQGTPPEGSCWSRYARACRTNCVKMAPMSGSVFSVSAADTS